MRDTSIDDSWSDAQNTLGLFDTETGKRLWKVKGHFCTEPVVAGDVVYVGNCDGTRIEARALSTGKVMRAWKTPDADYPAGNLIVTKNLLFFGTRRGVGAFDLKTGAVVWRYDRAGSMAISRRGVLFVRNRQDGDLGLEALPAINLR